MARICIITNGVVENVAIYAESPENPPPGYDNSYIAVESDIAGPGWLWDGNVFTDPNPVPDPQTPEPGLTTPRLVAAAFNVTIENSDVSGIEGAFNLVAALYLDIGQYMLLFLEPQSDTDYVPQIIDGDMSLRVSEKSTDYLLVEARDSGGVLSDASGFGVSVYRF